MSILREPGQFHTKRSTMRVAFLFSVGAPVLVWACLSLWRGEMLDLPEGVRWLIGLAFAGKAGQRVIENYGPGTK